MSESLVGLVGTVTLAVRGGDRPGEVRVSDRGIAHHLIAFSAEPIALGASVLVINNRGGRQFDVEPWIDPSSGVPDVDAIRRL